MFFVIILKPFPHYCPKAHLCNISLISLGDLACLSKVYNCIRPLDYIKEYMLPCPSDDIIIKNFS